MAEKSGREAGMLDLVPYRKGVYASFPTFVEHNGYVYIYYREGRKSVYQVHGLFGKVKRIKVSSSEFIKMLEGEPAGEFDVRVVFSDNDNELDAIVSKLDDNLYSLCTRVSLVGKRNDCYVSFNSEPEFKERQLVRIRGLRIDAFYGKAFRSPHGYIFPAYGWFERDGEQRPLLLVTDTEKWDVLSYLPTRINGNRLNESSVVYHQGVWHIFMREDDPPYGIWWSHSADLVHWSSPQKLFSKAHAPMACVVNNEILLAFRYLLGRNRQAVAYTYPFSSRIIQIADTYLGDMFDGGYADIGVVNGRLIVVYYWGNTSGSPTIRCRIIGAVEEMEKVA